MHTDNMSNSNTKNNPLVSIIIPCYNHAKFLDDGIRGLLNQTYQNIELIVCDDGSDDVSFQIWQDQKAKLQKRFTQFVLLRNEQNLGITKTLNKCLKLAEGDYIKIIASDDVLAENAIEEYVNAIAGDIDVYVSNGIKITENEHYPSFKGMGLFYKSAPDLQSERLYYRIAIYTLIFAPGVFLKKSIYDRYGAYDESIAIEDMEYWMRITQDGSVKFKYIDSPLVYYRIHANSVSSETNSPALEKKRLYMYKTELQILKKYQDKMPSVIYAQAVLDRTICEYQIANRFHLNGLIVQMKEELRQFDSWKLLPIQKRMFYRLRLLKRKLHF